MVMRMMMRIVQFMVINDGWMMVEWWNPTIAWWPLLRRWLLLVLPVAQLLASRYAGCGWSKRNETHKQLAVWMTPCPWAPTGYEGNPDQLIRITSRSPQADRHIDWRLGIDTQSSSPFVAVGYDHPKIIMIDHDWWWLFILNLYKWLLTIRLSL